MIGEWSNWKSFPDPSKGEYLCAPLGIGVYELRNSKTKELVLFGSSKNVSSRLCSLLPLPLGSGGRRNTDKQAYVMDNIKDVEFRCISFTSILKAKDLETSLKKSKEYLFKT